MNSRRSYCIFFCRFGRCNKGASCPFIHDASKIAVCTRFLRGTCKVVECPFSHQLAPEKMPVCSYFLQGRCSLDPCPYRHVKVNPKAEICKSFLKGYCDKGDQCKLRHEYICKECSKNNGKVKECLRCLKKRKQPSKPPAKRVRKDETNEPPNKANRSSPDNENVEQANFIPLASFHDPEREISHEYELIDNDTFASIRPFLPADYESDDSWDDFEGKPQLSNRKPLIRILPSFILEYPKCQTDNSLSR